jgi:olefin beta-lactone synthetase
MFGSPALIDTVGRYGQANGIRLPTLKRVITSGAPVSTKTLLKFSSMLEPDAEILTPYGATESMPVTVIGGHKILNETQKKSENGFGVCIGKPISEIEVSIIRITDDEISNWSDELMVAPGVIGEIVVKGKNVTRSYYNRVTATKLAKIKDGNEFRHRMGDLGYFDAEGYLWFCGRKAHRVKAGEKELYSIQCEYIFNNHPDVFRTALVEVNGKAVLCVEVEKNNKSIDLLRVKSELLDIAAAHPLTIDIDTILFHRGFPVDIRHNAKIIREKLAIWAKNKFA